MADNDQPDSLILRHLRALDAKLDAAVDKLRALERHSIATNETLQALRLNVHNLDQRLARVDTRLELRESVP